jgi:hypothetical protein
MGREAMTTSLLITGIIRAKHAAGALFQTAGGVL